MGKRLRLGVVGLVHDHVWSLLAQFKALEQVVIVSAADVNLPLLEAARSKFGIRRLYRNFLDMIHKEDLDAVLICTENSRHAEVVEIVAERGIHAIMEKPMSANLEQADRIVRATRRYGVKVMVNYPTTWNPAIQYAYHIVREGGIGRIFHIRFRAAHAGPKEIGCSPYFYRWLYDKELNGGGAFMDYCCYGVNIALWFIGYKPRSVIATMGTFARTYLTVDDNAILIMEYGTCLGVAEASWAQIGQYPMRGLTVNGTDGTIFVDQDSTLKLFHIREKGNYRDIESKILTPPPPPKGRRSGPEYFTMCVQEDLPIEPPLSAEFNRDVQEVLEAGIKSAVEGRRIYL